MSALPRRDDLTNQVRISHVEHLSAHHGSMGSEAEETTVGQFCDWGEITVPVLDEYDVRVIDMALRGGAPPFAQTSLASGHQLRVIAPTFLILMSAAPAPASAPAPEGSLLKNVGAAKTPVPVHCWWLTTNIVHQLIQRRLVLPRGSDQTLFLPPNLHSLG